MDILAIETSTARGSLALWRNGRVVDAREFHAERAHNSALFSPLGALMDQLGTLRLVVVGTGPGSYTGVRVGIAAAIGISLARAAPLIGLPSVCALADAAGLERYAVCGDARRGAWWWAEVHRGTLTGAPAVSTLEETTALAGAWSGRIFTADAVSPPFCDAIVSWPKAELLAVSAAGLSEREVARLADVAVEPVYLRAPFITVSKKPVFATAKI